MNFITNNIKESELANWIIDYLYIFIKPQKVLSAFLKLDSSERVRKLIFHFTVFIGSLFLFEGTYEKLNWLKLVTSSTISIIPLCLLALISVKLVRSKSSFEDVVFYILLSFLLLQPLTNLLISKYFLSENYVYYVFEEFLSYITLIWLYINFCIIFGRNKVQATYLFLVGYVIWNLIFVLIVRASDRYSHLNQSLFSDPIYEEYQFIESQILQKEKSLVTRFCIVSPKPTKTTCFSVAQNVINDSTAQTDNDIYIKYKKDIRQNIEFLNEISVKVQSSENRRIVDLWLQYFSLINSELKTDSLIKNRDEVLKQNMNLVENEKSTGTEFYVSSVNSIADQVMIRTHLVAYNNRMKRHYNFNESFDIGIRATIYLLGSSLDYFLGKYIFDDGKPKVDKNDFYELP